MALVLSLPVLCGFLADLLVTRNLDFWPLVYGLMAAPLWVGAAAPGVGRLLAADAPAASPEVAQPPFWRLMPRWAAPRRS
jgi:hypothetical protein